MILGIIQAPVVEPTIAAHVIRVRAIHGSICDLHKFKRYGPESLAANVIVLPSLYSYGVECLKQNST